MSKIKYLDAWKLARCRRRGFATPQEIAQARRVAGLRISDAAELLAVSPSTLRNWEHGRSRCPVVYWEFLLIVTCGSRFDQQLRWVKSELTAARHWGIDRVNEGCSQRTKKGQRVSP